MILAHKYLDLKTCVLNIASLMLKELSSTKMMQLDALSALVTTNLGEDAKYNFMPALSFLYLIGRVRYDLQSDAIVLI